MLMPYIQFLYYHDNNVMAILLSTEAVRLIDQTTHYTCTTADYVAHSSLM